jgi:hypothetical protein
MPNKGKPTIQYEGNGKCPVCQSLLNIVEEKLVCPEGHYEIVQTEFEQYWDDFIDDKLTIGELFANVMLGVKQ